MKISKKLLAGVLAGTVALTGVGLVDLPIGNEAQKVEAATVSSSGVSFNPIRDNWYDSDVEVVIAIDNHNTYDVGLKSQVQKYVNGSWVNYAPISNTYTYGSASFAVVEAYTVNVGTPYLAEPGTYRIKYNIYKDGVYQATTATSAFYRH